MFGARRIFVVAAVVAIAFSVGAAKAEIRTWTDWTGRQVKAELVRLHEGKVILRHGAHIVTIPLVQLSREDKSYIEEKQSKERQAKLEKITNRTWSDVSGKFTVEAKVIELIDGKVRLRKEDGNEIEVSLDVFSKEDQKYIKDKIGLSVVDLTGFWRVASNVVVALEDKGDKILVEVVSGPTPWGDSTCLLTLYREGPVVLEKDKSMFGNNESGNEKQPVRLEMVSDTELIMRSECAVPDPDFALGSRRTKGGWFHYPREYKMERMSLEEEMKIVEAIKKRQKEELAQGAVAFAVMAVVLAGALGEENDPGAALEFGFGLAEAANSINKPSQTGESKDEKGSPSSKGKPDKKSSAPVQRARIDLYVKWPSGKPARRQYLKCYIKGALPPGYWDYGETDVDGYRAINLDIRHVGLEVYFSGKKVYDGYVVASSNGTPVHVTLAD